MSERTKFTEGIVGLSGPVGHEVFDMHEYLSAVRNRNFLPVSAPFLIRNALGYAVELMNKGEESPLDRRLSPGVVKMLNEMLSGMGWDEELNAAKNEEKRVGDRKPWVIFAQVNGSDESAEFSQALMTCVRAYASQFARGRGYCVLECRFKDDPLLLLSGEARENLNGAIKRGGPVDGECCGRCALYRASGAEMALVGTYDVERHAVLNDDVPGSFAMANRGLLEVRNVWDPGGLAALEIAAGGMVVDVDGVSVVPDVLLVCQIGWGEDIPKLAGDRSIVVASHRPQDDGEMADVIGREINRLSGSLGRHVSPRVALMAAHSIIALDGDGGSGGAVKRIEKELHGTDNCLTHNVGFSMFFVDRGLDDSAMSGVSDELCGDIERDVLMAYGSVGGLRFEHVAARNLIEEYLRPLGFVRMAKESGGVNTGDDVERLENFEADMRNFGVLKTSDDDKIETFQNDVFEVYALECRALALMGKDAFVRRSSDGTETGWDSSLPIDMESFRYDRNSLIGTYLERRLLADVGQFREAKDSKDPAVTRSRVVSVLRERYGYCEICGNEAYDMTFGGERFYVKAWSMGSWLRGIWSDGS